MEIEVQAFMSDEHRATVERVALIQHQMDLKKVEELFEGNHRAFIKKILIEEYTKGNPSLARLIYADWLEEQGDPRSHLLRLAEIVRKREKGKLYENLSPGREFSAYSFMDEVFSIATSSWKAYAGIPFVVMNTVAHREIGIDGNVRYPTGVTRHELLNWKWMERSPRFWYSTSKLLRPDWAYLLIPYEEDSKNLAFVERISND